MSRCRPHFLLGVIGIVLILIISTQFARSESDWQFWNIWFASQRDLGNDTKLANSNVSFKRWGCYVTTIWMVLYASHARTGQPPSWLRDLATFNQYLKTKNACAADGTLKGSIQRELGIADHTPSQSLLNQLLETGPVIVKKADPQHFVIVFARNGNTYYILDPLWSNEVSDQISDQITPQSYAALGAVRLRTFPDLAGQFIANPNPWPNGSIYGPLPRPVNITEQSEETGEPPATHSAQNPVQDLKELAETLRGLTEGKPTLELTISSSYQETDQLIKPGPAQTNFKIGQPAYIIIRLTNAPKYSLLDLDVRLGRKNEFNRRDCQGAPVESFLYEVSTTTAGQIEIRVTLRDKNGNPILARIKKIRITP